MHKGTSSPHIFLGGSCVFDLRKPVFERSVEADDSLHELGRLDSLFKSLAALQRPVDDLNDRVPIPLGIVRTVEYVAVDQQLPERSIVEDQRLM